MERLQRADRCQDHRHPPLSAEQVVLRSIFDTSTQTRGRSASESMRQAVAPQCRLGFGRADQVAPDMVGQFGSRRGDELVQALKIAGRLEKMFGFGLIHGLPPLPRSFASHQALTRENTQGRIRPAGLLSRHRASAIPGGPLSAGRVSGIATHSSAVAMAPDPRQQQEHHLRAKGCPRSTRRGRC